MCTLCRRNLMAGERFRLWQADVSAERRRAVCGLCEREAAREGWVPVAQPMARESAVGLRGTVRLVA
jgi:hypothetical protein